jgi:threonine dehydrogenase-like Zn-dependent dehydrogenase
MRRFFSSTDILPTGYAAIEWGKMTGGETVAVFGCGPVGLMAQKVAWPKGAKRVIGVDLQLLSGCNSDWHSTPTLHHSA